MSIPAMDSSQENIPDIEQIVRKLSVLIEMHNPDYYRSDEEKAEHISAFMTDLTGIEVFTMLHIMSEKLYELISENE